MTITDFIISAIENEDKEPPNDQVRIWHMTRRIVALEWWARRSREKQN